jgi:glutaredoxin
MSELKQLINEFNISSEDAYTIFSKDNCQWCESAKELLDELREEGDEGLQRGYNYFDCTEILKTNKPEFINEINKLSGVEIKTFPIIFKGKKYIGGFQELRRYLN